MKHLKLNLAGRFALFDTCILLMCAVSVFALKSIPLLVGGIVVWVAVLWLPPIGVLSRHFSTKRSRRWAALPAMAWSLAGLFAVPGIPVALWLFSHPVEDGAWWIAAIPFIGAAGLGFLRGATLEIFSKLANV